jgi:hypothetical protein
VKGNHFRAKPNEIEPGVVGLQRVKGPGDRHDPTLLGPSALVQFDSCSKTPIRVPAPNGCHVGMQAQAAGNRIDGEEPKRSDHGYPIDSTYRQVCAMRCCSKVRVDIKNNVGPPRILENTDGF